MAGRGRFATGTIQWQLQSQYASNQGKDTCFAWKDRLIFPVSLERWCYGMMLILCRPEDSEIEVANMKPGIGKMEAFPSIWGHWAGGPGDSKEDVKWLNDKLREIGL